MMNRYFVIERKISVLKEMLEELELTNEERIKYETYLKEMQYKLAALDNAWFYDEI